MLPRDLLVVRKRKGSIRPCYLSDTILAEKLIQVYTQYQGQKYKKVLEKREELESDDFKVVRGLGTLLERRCSFVSSSDISGRDVRSFLFEHGFVTTLEERDKLLKNASNFFQVSKSEVEKAMFSDLWEEQVLSGVKLLSPDELIRMYNLSLTQTLLFDALGLNFKVEGNYQFIFRQIKYLGLMYEIDDSVKVTGPGSLFKKNRKYGTSLAKLLPVIMNAEKWEINAIIETIIGGEPRVLDFDLDSESKVAFPVSTESVTHFDSEVEQQFFRDFKALNLGWEIVREPDVVKAGNYVVIPDFGFYKDGLKHYLEVVGFWTPEYLKKKISKLKEAEATITVAVNENLNCKKQDFHGDIIFYNNKIPLMDIVKILREIEEKQIEKELDELGEINISEDVVSIKKMAEELHVNPKTLTEVEIPDYIVIGEQIVSKIFLEKVKDEIRPFQEYQKVEEILSTRNLTTLSLEYMGYKIVWDGLHPIKVVEKTGETKPE
jgi:predicted nuclease of restriction endonuclease-like RecB superfamily